MQLYTYLKRQFIQLYIPLTVFPFYVLSRFPIENSVNATEIHELQLV